MIVVLCRYSTAMYRCTGVERTPGRIAVGMDPANGDPNKLN